MKNTFKHSILPGITREKWQQISQKDSLISEYEGKTIKEKIEIARQLEKLNADIIELPEITDGKTDILLVRTGTGASSSP